jgi:hypothetical protein
MVQAGARWRSTAQPGEDEVTDGVRVIASKQPRNAAAPEKKAEWKPHGLTTEDPSTCFRV